MHPLSRLEADNPGTLQEIIDACRNQQAFLFERPGAGWVLKPQAAGGVVGVFVWAAWSSRRDGLARYQPEIERLARMIGARWLRFHSKRTGFLRVAVILGWRHIGVDGDGFHIFEKTL